MKRSGFLTAVLVAALLCGCSNKDTSSPNDASSVVSTNGSGGASSGGSGENSVNSDGGTSSKPEDNSVQSSGGDGSDPDTESKHQSEDETFLVGLAGDRILKSEISEVFTNDGSDCAPEDLTEEKFSAVLCDGFVYVAEPSKVSRNSEDNVDVYDAGNMEFTDISSEPVKGFKRLEVGDTICGLTLTEAQVNFARGSEQMTFRLSDGTQKTGAELGLPEIYFASGSAKFDGELQMTGYICRVAENDYGVGTGDIVFIPSDGEGNIPIMSYRLDGDNGFHHMSQTYSLSGMAWQNEFGYIYLGNASDTSADIYMLPDDGSFIKARVTIDSLVLTCGVNFINSVTADIVDIEEL